VPVPVLLAGILQHCGQRGPAEIPSKRRFTYRYVLWRAHRLGVPLRMPPAHPFNPLQALRLIIAAGCTRQATTLVLDAVFRDGQDVSDPAVLSQLGHALGVADVAAALAEGRIKEQLRRNTDWAIALGVFGVPTLCIGTECFWGEDAIDMAADYLSDRAWFISPQMQGIDTLPVGAVRKS
jgi:2-hydroxychromene-2-carboxylate isomerase